MPLITAHYVYGKNGAGHWGPFQRNNGDLYAFTLNASSDWSTTIEPHVSDDDGATWSAETTYNWGDRVLCFWAEYDSSNDLFHTACHVDGGTVLYNTYDPDTDSWGTEEEVNSHANGNSPGFGVVLTIDPTDGDIWILYQDDYENVGGSNYRRLGLAHRTAADTYTKYAVDEGGTQNWTGGHIRFDSDGLLHILYGSWQTRPWYRTFAPGTETFGTAEDLAGTNSAFTVTVARRLAYYEDGAVQRMVASWRGVSNYPYSASIDDGSPNSPGAITAAAAAVWDSSNDAVLTLVEDASELKAYAIFADASTNDVWVDVNDDDAGWGTDVEAVDGVTARFVDANVYVNSDSEVVIGIIYDESGTGVTYVEYYLRDAASAVEFAGALAGSTTITGAISNEVTFGGSVSGSTAAAASLSIELSFAGELDGSTEVEGDFLTNVVIIYFSGSIAGSTEIEGEIANEVAFAGTLAGSTTLAGFLSLPTSALYSWSFYVDWDGDGVYESNEGGRMIGLDVRRGRSDTVAPQGGGWLDYEEGVAIVRLDNSDGRYDAWNTASPLYGELYPGRRCYVEVSGPTWSQRIYTGVIDDIRITGRRETAQITLAEPPIYHEHAVRLAALQNYGVQDLVDQVVIAATGERIEQPFMTYSTFLILGRISVSVAMLAQRFVAHASGTLDLAYFHLYSVSGTAGNIYVRVAEDSGGEPGAVIKQVEVPGATLVTGWQGVSLGNDVSVVEGETYWLTFELVTPPASTDYHGMSVSPDDKDYFPFGSISSSGDGGSTWVPSASGRDMVFRILIRGTTDSLVRYGVTADTIPWWWPTHESAIGCLNDIASAVQDDIYVNKEGGITHLIRGASSIPSFALEEDDVLKNIEFAQPWEYLRNDVSIEAVSRSVGDTTVLWSLDDRPSVTPNGGYYDITIKYSSLEGEVPATGLITPVMGTDYIANTHEDGEGTDITGTTRISLTAYGDRARILINNMGLTPAYITKLELRGRPIDPDSRQITRIEDVESVVQYGRRIFSLSNPLIQGYWASRPLADWTLDLLKAPSLSGVVRQESRGVEDQFAADLGHKLSLDLDVMDIDSDFKIVGIEHNWLDDTGQSVVTTWRFEAWRDYSSYFTFDETLPEELGA